MKIIEVIEVIVIVVLFAPLGVAIGLHLAERYNNKKIRRYEQAIKEGHEELSRLKGLEEWLLRLLKRKSRK